MVEASSPLDCLCQGQSVRLGRTTLGRAGAATSFALVFYLLESADALVIFGGKVCGDARSKAIQDNELLMREPGTRPEAAAKKSRRRGGEPTACEAFNTCPSEVGSAPDAYPGGGT